VHVCILSMLQESHSFSVITRPTMFSKIQWFKRNYNMPSICRIHSSTQEKPAYFMSLDDSDWSFIMDEVSTCGFTQQFESIFKRAFDELPQGRLPSICVVKLSTSLAENLSNDLCLSVLEKVLSSVSSINYIVGVVVDDPDNKSLLSITLGVASKRVLSVFHVDDIKVDNTEFITSILPKKSIMDSEVVSLVLYPHSSFPADRVLSVIQTLDNSFDNIERYGTILSSSPNLQFSGFLAERQYPLNTVKFVRSGLLGISVASNLKAFESALPFWQKSLVPMLKWVQSMGH